MSTSLFMDDKGETRPFKTKGGPSGISSSWEFLGVNFRETKGKEVSLV